MHLHELLNPAFQAEKWTAEDLQNVATQLGVQIAVDGEVSVSASSERSDAFVLNAHLAATQIQNGRKIAEVTRSIETESGNMEVVVDRKAKDFLEQVSAELASQVFEAWGRGTIGSSLYKLVIRGRVPLLVQEALKEEFTSKVHEVKVLKERLLAQDQIVFEMDSLLGPRDIAKKLTELEVSGYKLTLESSSDVELVYKVNLK